MNVNWSFRDSILLQVPDNIPDHNSKILSCLKARKLELFLERFILGNQVEENAKKNQVSLGKEAWSGKYNIERLIKSKKFDEKEEKVALKNLCLGVYLKDRWQLFMMLVMT